MIQLFYVMFSACMIGGSLHGTGYHFDNLAPDNRVTAMEVRIASFNFSWNAHHSSSYSTGGFARLHTASLPFSARYPFAFSYCELPSNELIFGSSTSSWS